MSLFSYGIAGDSAAVGGTTEDFGVGLGVGVLGQIDGQIEILVERTRRPARHPAPSAIVQVTNPVLVEMAVVIVKVHVPRQGQLLEIAAAGDPLGHLLGLAQGGQQYPDKQDNHRYYNQ